MHTYIYNMYMLYTCKGQQTHKNMNMIESMVPSKSKKLNKTQSNIAFKIF